MAKLETLFSKQKDFDLDDLTELRDSIGKIYKTRDKVFFELVEGNRRDICGFEYSDGSFCREYAGTGTNHVGIGRCYKHHTLQEETRLLQLLNEQRGEGATFGDLIQKVEHIREVDLSKVDNEIKMLYALELNILQEIDDNGGMISRALERRLLAIVKELRETKLIRGRLEQLQKIDSAYVAYIFEKIAIIVRNLAPEKADQIISTLLNTFRAPYQDVIESGTSPTLVDGEVKLKDLDE